MARLSEEELIRNDTFIGCVVIPPDKLRQMTNNEDLQFGGSREHKFEDFGKDENERVEEKIQMWILGEVVQKWQPLSKRRDFCKRVWKICLKTKHLFQTA